MANATKPSIDAGDQPPRRRARGGDFPLSKEVRDFTLAHVEKMNRQQVILFCANVKGISACSLARQSDTSKRGTS